MCLKRFHHLSVSMSFIFSYEYNWFFPDIDECVPEPCQNNGTCIDEINGYECRCVSGFNGTMCENSKFHQLEVENKQLDNWF